MAKFNYRMQNILDIKKKLETQAKFGYAQANQKLETEEEKLNDLKNKQNAYDEQHRQMLLSTLNILEIKNCRKSIEGVKGALSSQRISVHVAKKNVEIARAKLRDVSIERRTFEKLREKEFENFKQEMLRHESKEIDELISYVHGNNE